MSGFFKCQVTLERDGALPEDSIVNTWYFDSDQTFAEDADDVAGRLIAFYQAISAHLSPLLSGNGTVKVYDMANPEPRVPGHVQTFTHSTSTNTAPFPAEIAVCLSFKAADVSGERAARRRGRVFLPIGDNGQRDAQIGGDLPVGSGVRTTVLNAAVTLAKGPDAGDARHAVFSPTAAGVLAPTGYTTQQLDTAFNDVVTYWIDNRFDVIRKRGSAPTARSTAVVP